MSDASDNNNTDADRFRQIFDLSPDPAWIFDNHQFVECNQAAADFLGYPDKQTLFNTHPSELSPEYQPDGEPSRTKAERMAMIAFEKGRHRFEWVHRRLDGSDFWAEVSCSAIMLGGRRVLYIVWRDISKRIEAEQEVQRYQQELEQRVEERTLQLSNAMKRAESANIAKSAFLANMSHEIRTPLNAINGMAHLIRKAGLSAQQAQRMDKLEAASNHLLSIINSILELSKIEAGKYDVEASPINLHQICDEVVAMLADDARQKNLALDLSLPSLPGGLVGDALKLRQCLLNYLSNAIKFTEHGEIRISASVLEETPGAALIRFEVSDTGPGIEPAAMSRLFQAFEQVDNSNTRNFGGSGLGLAITRLLAEMMGGEAGASSQPGLGSQFWFTVRFDRSDDTLESTVAPAEPYDALAALQSAFRGSAVLLVEDDEINREIARTLLEEAGLAITDAADGAQAVEQASRGNYALILMDIQMPVMDGMEATRRLRADPATARVPILALTANAYAEDRRMALAAGMDDFVTKPVEPDVLYERVYSWLSRDGGISKV